MIWSGPPLLSSIDRRLNCSIKPAGKLRRRNRVSPPQRTETQSLDQTWTNWEGPFAIAWNVRAMARREVALSPGHRIDYWPTRSRIIVPLSSLTLFFSELTTDPSAALLAALLSFRSEIPTTPSVWAVIGRRELLPDGASPGVPELADRTEAGADPPIPPRGVPVAPELPPPVGAAASPLPLPELF